MELEIIELKKSLSSMEIELKTNRGTIDKLASEAKQQHTNSSEYLSQIQAFIKEKEEQDLVRKSLSQKIDELKVINEIKDNETEILTKQILMLNEKLMNAESHTSGEINNLKYFKNKIIRVLFGTSDHISDENIFNKANDLNDIETENRRLKEENAKLSSNLSQMPDEQEVNKMKIRVRSLEAELSETISLKERKNKEQEKALKFIHDLGHVLGIDEKEFSPEVDPLMDAILFRSGQLHKNEGSLVTNQKTQIYSLQRKNKSLNDSISSKNFHLDLLKRKLTTLEEQKVNKSDFEKEKDDANVKVKKLMKLVDNYKRELALVSKEMLNMRERLQNALTTASENQNREGKLEELMVQKLDLETLCRELNSRIEALKKDKNEGKKLKDRLREEHEMNTKDLIKDLELKSSKIVRLEEQAKQNNSFRQKLSELLSHNDPPIQGLPPVKTGSKFSPLNLEAGTRGPVLSEEEILSRLKMLIETSRQNAATAYVLDSALSDMAEGLKAGYQKAAMNVARETIHKPTTLGSFEKSLKSLVLHTL